MSPENGTRLLVAAGEAVDDPQELPSLVRSLLRAAVEVLVMTPILVSGLRWVASDTDAAHYEADDRLGTILGQMQALAPDASTRGRVGDDTPLTAFSDAIRDFRPDHILIALRAADHAAWQERELVEELLRRFHVPVTVFEIDRSGRIPPPAAT